MKFLLLLLPFFAFAEEAFLLTGPNGVLVEFGDTESRSSPCSTFKIALCHIAFQTDTLTDIESARPWIQYSLLPFSIELVEKLDPVIIRQYLKEYDYGNQDMTGDIPYWVNAALAISAVEQCEYVEKLLASPPFQEIKELFYLETLPGAKLYGKTGWGGEHKVAWFVGWIECSDTCYPFAYRTLATREQLPLRIPRVKEILHQMQHIRLP